MCRGLEAGEERGPRVRGRVDDAASVIGAAGRVDRGEPVDERLAVGRRQALGEHEIDEDVDAGRGGSGRVGLGQDGVGDCRELGALVRRQRSRPPRGERRRRGLLPGVEHARDERVRRERAERGE